MSRPKPKLQVGIPDEQSQSYKVDEDGKFIHGPISIGDHGLTVNSSANDRDEDSSEHEMDSKQIEMYDKLGVGASSVVHRAYHRQLNKYMAIKTINIGDRARRHQILKELHTLHKAECPYMISFYGAYFKDGSISIALELMDAGSLADIIEKAGKIPEPELAAFAKQLLEGLHYLRKRHQVHRDIKPSNICLNTEGEAKLSDFGITTQLDNTLEACESFVGTCSYMSPERIMGEKYGYSSDIWSLGLVLLECATGQFPYPTTGVYLEMMQSVVNGAVPSVPKDEFSPEFASFINKCLIKDPDQRWTAEELLSHPWFRRVRPVSPEDLKRFIAATLNKQPKTKKKNEHNALWNS